MKTIENKIKQILHSDTPDFMIKAVVKLFNREIKKAVDKAEKEMSDKINLKDLIK